MKRILAATAALLISASSALCAPARAQQPARAPAASAPRARPAAPAASRAPGSGEPAGAARRVPVYRVELVVFRATTALGAPEDWAAEAGTSPVTSTDADPSASGSAARADAGQAGDGDPAAAAADSTQASGAPAGAAQPDAANASGTAPNPARPSGTPPDGVVRLLPSSEFELDGVASRLRASGHYVPVAHVAWAQNASPWGKPVQIPVQSVGLDAQGITGTVALERGVFLHLALDLRYAMSDPPAGLDAPAGTVFVLDESHRVRLKERNYFDHPAFGVIALVTTDQARGRPAR